MFFNKKLKKFKKLKDSYISEGEEDDDKDSDKEEKESELGLKRPRSQVLDVLDETPIDQTPDKVQKNFDLGLGQVTMEEGQLIQNKKVTGFDQAATVVQEFARLKEVADLIKVKKKELDDLHKEWKDLHAKVIVELEDPTKDI